VRDVPFVVTEVADVTPIYDVLTSLARVNSDHLDIGAEANLPHSRIWCALENNTPIAYAVIWLLGDELELIDVATAEHARRRGAARTLLRAVVEHYRDAGSTAMFLEVRAGNQPAIQLYESLGFDTTRTRRGYYSNGEDALEMRLNLEAQPHVTSTPDGATP
jgi:ribosomal-protein-alanine N-acetyltransferase